jgi:hypothetical protein
MNTHREPTAEEMQLLSKALDGAHGCGNTAYPSVGHYVGAGETMPHHSSNLGTFAFHPSTFSALTVQQSDSGSVQVRQLRHDA